MPGHGYIHAYIVNFPLHKKGLTYVTCGSTRPGISM